MRTFTLFALIAALTLTGCATGTNPADPYESFNRSVYKFNDTLDRTIAKPVAQGYEKVMPTIGKVMVNNFFSNLDDVVVTANDLLQLKIRQAASDGIRVIFNSTIGVFGLFNVTTRLEKHHEDFGQTLGYWGMGPGPYLMLPILGPSDLRDSAGLVVDTIPGPIGKITPVATRNELYILEQINLRGQLLDAEKVMDEASLDKYDFLRNAYLQHRLNLVYDGDPPRPKYDDDSGDDAPAPAPADKAAPEQPAK
ncbi:MAG: VacJ family lipoprotein [Gallionella sp.]